MNRIYLLFDVPDNKNDKQWLFDELKNMCIGGVESISISKTLSTYERTGGILARIHSRFIMLYQSFRACVKADNKDTIICWRLDSGLYTSLLLRMARKKTKLICMNWLTPSKGHMKRKKLMSDTTKNENTYVILNSPESVGQWKNFLNLETTKNFVLLPDVYDDHTPFNNYISAVRDEKYCFTGGMNNRDWKLLIGMANTLKNVKFVCVALRKDFEKQVSDMDEIPSNMIVYFDTNSEEYYRLMSNAYLVVLPLIDERVAGLINILKAAQFGIPCLCSKTKATEQYYSYKLNDKLLITNKEEWIERVEKIYSSTEEQYISIAEEFQKFIQQEFSPYQAAKKIYSLINIS